MKYKTTTIAGLYRKHISAIRRAKIYDAFLGKMLTNFRNISSWYKGIWIYVFSPLYPKNEYYDAFRFIGRHGVTFYPFKTSTKYKHANICVEKEKDIPRVSQWEKIVLPTSNG
jgi:hypothetical protein